jgi:hypothetical protein
LKQNSTPADFIILDAAGFDFALGFEA